MGKNKSGQRTKGNQKPSSSSRSAELVQQAGGFTGFSDIDSRVVPISSQLDEDCSIPADIRVTLRKMAKKDATTKIKALQEFDTYCQTGDVETLKVILPYWPRLYTKLALDFNKNVREETQRAHKHLISRTKKEFAPYLKAIMPTWLLAMSDPQTTVAMRANAAFTESFSEEKRANALMFCCDEILKCISTELESPEPTEKVEDFENKYVRIICCSLKSLGIFVECISKTKTVKNCDKEEVYNKLLPILDSKTFWKFYKHNNYLIVAAWLQAIQNFLNCEDSFIVPYHSQIAIALFSLVNPSDAYVLPYSWGAMYSLWQLVPDCWNYCPNTDKTLSNFLEVLKDGGRGNAFKLKDLILKMLPDFPKAYFDKCKLYEHVIEAVTSSLEKKQVICDRMEVDALISIIFASNEVLAEKTLDDSILSEIIGRNIVQNILKSWKSVPQLKKSCLCEEVRKTLINWQDDKRWSIFWTLLIIECKNLLLDESEKTKEKKKVTFNELDQSEIENVGANKATLDGMLAFFQGINGSIAKGVHFDEEESVRSEFVDRLGSEISPLINFIYDSLSNCKRYELFCQLLILYPTREVYCGILGRDTEKYELAFAKDIILPFLNDQSDVPVTLFLKIFINLYKSLDQESKETLLFSLKPTMSTLSLYSLIEEIFRDPNDAIGSKWLQSPQLGCTLVRKTQNLFAFYAMDEDLISETMEEEIYNLVCLVQFLFSNETENGPIISKEYLSQMLKVLHSVLKMRAKNSSDKNSDDSIDLILKLLSSFLSNKNCFNNYEFYFISFTLLEEMVFSSGDGHVWCQILNYFQHKIFQAYFVKGFNNDFWMAISHKVKEILCKCETLISETATLSDKSIEENSNEISVFFAMERLIDVMINAYVVAHQSLDESEPFRSNIQHIVNRSPNKFFLFTKTEPLFEIVSVYHEIHRFSLAPELKTNSCWEKFLPYYMYYIRIHNGLKFKIELPTVDEPTFFNIVFGAIYLLQMEKISKSQWVTYSEDLRMCFADLKENVAILLQSLNLKERISILQTIAKNINRDGIRWGYALNILWENWPLSSKRSALEDMEYFDSSMNATYSLLQNLHLETEEVLSKTLFKYMPGERKYNYLCFRIADLEENKRRDFVLKSNLSVVANLADCKEKDYENKIHLLIDTLKTFVNEGYVEEDQNRSLKVELQGAILNVLSEIVKHQAECLRVTDWDFILIYLNICISDCKEHPAKEYSIHSVRTWLMCIIGKSLGIIGQVMDTIRNDNSGKYPVNLKQEWNNFHTKEIYPTMFSMTMDCSDLYSFNKENVFLFEVCSSLACALSTMSASDTSLIKSPAGSKNSGKSLESRIGLLAQFIHSPHPGIQLMGYYLLKKLLPEYAETYEKQELKDAERPLPEFLSDLLEYYDEKLNSILFIDDEEQERIFDIEVNPNCDFSHMMTAYLTTFSLILKFYSLSSSRRQETYVTYFRSSDIVKTLLNRIRRVIYPYNATDFMKVEKGYYFNKSLNNNFSNYGKLVPTLASKNYYKALLYLPAIARHWFSSLGRNIQGVVSKFTSDVVSPSIISEEFKHIRTLKDKFDQMKFTIEESKNMVTASYTIEDVNNIELELKLTAHHPLSAVSFQHQKMGMSAVKWKTWIFGLSTMLSHRNNSIVNSLLYWKKNVDKKFEGLEECFICYSILQGEKNLLPKLSCKTCKKKFHSSCLYKWFNTSNNAACPICRSQF